MACKVVYAYPMDEAVVSPRSSLALAVYTSVRSSLKKIRLRFHRGFEYTEDFLWWLFHGFPPYCLLMAFGDFVAEPLHIGIVICAPFALFCTAIQAFLFYTLIYWNTYTPYKLLGAQGRFMIEFIPALTAAAWHQLLVFKLGDLSLFDIFNAEYGPICLLLACTTYFYQIAHFMHRAYDISPKDVIVGLAMQVLCYMLCGELFIRALALFFCFSLCLYRYATYAAPDVIPHPKREAEELPC